jgi:hypothetical protein
MLARQRTIFSARITGLTGLKRPETSLNPVNPVILAKNDRHAKQRWG